MVELRVFYAQCYCATCLILMLLLWWLRHQRMLSAMQVDLGSIPGSVRSPGEGNGYLLQYSCLENSINRVAWWVMVHGVVKSRI